jgi:hypothetical protein
MLPALSEFECYFFFKKSQTHRRLINALLWGHRSSDARSHAQQWVQERFV